MCVCVHMCVYVCVCVHVCVFMCVCVNVRVFERDSCIISCFFLSILQLHSFDHILHRATKNLFRQSSVWEQVLGKEEALVSSDEVIK